MFATGPYLRKMRVEGVVPRRVEVRRAAPARASPRAPRLGVADSGEHAAAPGGIPAAVVADGPPRRQQQLRWQNRRGKEAAAADAVQARASVPMCSGVEAASWAAGTSRSVGWLTPMLWPARALPSFVDVALPIALPCIWRLPFVAATVRLPHDGQAFLQRSRPAREITSGSSRTKKMRPRLLFFSTGSPPSFGHSTPTAASRIGREPLHSGYFEQARNWPKAPARSPSAFAQIALLVALRRLLCRLVADRARILALREAVAAAWPKRPQRTIIGLPHLSHVSSVCCSTRERRLPRRAPR